jgi:leukotriene-A4 hydrolase
MSDPTTQANYLEITTEHALFNWVVDFQQKIISGYVIHDLKVKEDGVKEIMLVDISSLALLAVHSIGDSFDTGDLEIESVSVGESSVSVSLIVSICQWMKHRAEMRMKYDLKAKHEVMGSALHIPLPSGLKAGTSVEVKVCYRTTKDCTALQWLEKEYVADVIRKAYL